MPDNLVGDIDGANNALSKMDRLLKGLTETFGKFGKAASGAMQPVGNGGTGAIGLGVGSQNRLMTALGKFTTPPTGNVGATWGWANKMNLGLSAAQGGMTALFGGAAGFLAAMPDVEMTTARSTAFYNSSLINGLGPGGRSRIQNAVFGAMKGGISNPGGDAQAAGIFTGMGVRATFDKNGNATGQFGNLLTSTANAAKYLNIDNASAAQALGGLTQGGTSSALMRNFGIYTTDPVTGRRLKPTEIFEQLNQRITGGQKLSVKDLQTSMQGGALAVDLQNSGLDSAQQSMAYQYMLDKAKGKTMDLGSDKTMTQLQKEAGINPEQSIYSATTSQTATMNAASDAYIKGMQKATGYIDQFNKAMQGFLKSPAGEAMAELNAGYNLASKDPTVSGGMGAIGAGLTGLGQIGAAYFGGKVLTGMLRKNGVLPGKGAGGAGGGVVPPGMGGKATKLPKGYKFTKNGRVYNTAANRLATKAETEAIATRAPGLLRNVGGKLLRGGMGSMVGDLATGVAGMTGANQDQSYWTGLGTSFAAGEVIGGAETFGVSGLISAGIYAATNWGQTSQAFGDLFSGKGWGAGGWGGDGGASLIGTGGNSATDAGNSNFTLIHPVGKATIVCKYGQYDELHPNGHWAVDWAAKEGFGIMAAADGTVIQAEGNSANTLASGNHSYGLHVKIDHGNGYATLYAHMSGFDVSVGQKVTQGQQIGRVGNTGYSQAPHLHFELWQGGKRIDPSPFLGANYRDNSGVAGGGGRGVSRGGSAEGADLLGFNTGAAGNGLKIPSSYSGAASSDPNGSGVTDASSGTTGTLIGKGATTTKGSGGGSMGTTGGGDGPSGGGRSNVTINVTVAQASESEARRFAKLIKEYLDADTLTSTMGRI
jgi:hypothetical protein